MFLRIVALLFINILLACCNPSPFATAKPPTPTLENPAVRSELTLTLSKQIYTTREPITATVTWKVTQGWIDAMSTYVDDLDFDLSLVNSKGELVPYTRDANSRLSISRFEYRLNAETEPDIRMFDIRGWFNVLAPDTYTLTVARRFVLDSSAMRAGLATETKVVSQPVTFIVVSP